MITEHRLEAGKMVSAECNSPVFQILQASDSPDKIVEVSTEHFEPTFERYEFFPYAFNYSTGESHLELLAVGISQINSKLIEMPEKLLSEPYNCDHVFKIYRLPPTAFPAEGKPLGPIIVKDDLESFLKEIQFHNCNNRKIISWDDPVKLMIGFACRCGYWWQTDVRHIRQCPNKELADRFSNNENKNALANDLSKELVFDRTSYPATDIVSDGEGFENSGLVYLAEMAIFGWYGDDNQLSLRP